MRDVFFFSVTLIWFVSNVDDFEAAWQNYIVPNGVKVELVWAVGKFTEGPTLGSKGVIFFSDIG